MGFISNIQKCNFENYVCLEIICIDTNIFKIHLPNIDPSLRLIWCMHSLLKNHEQRNFFNILISLQPLTNKR